METNSKEPVGTGSVLKKKAKKWLRNFIIILIIGLGLYIYVQFFYVFATGTRAGQLNYVVYKGYVFKTYEGKLIQSGIRSPKVGQGTVESEKFEFSVSDKGVAEKLMLAGGRDVELHYKEYLGMVPWRGYSKYVVDSIINIQESPATYPKN